MTEEEEVEKAKNNIVKGYDLESALRAEIEKQQKEIEQKDKIIDIMSEHLEKHSTFCIDCYGANKCEWKKYFENKVKEENNNGKIY